MDSSSSSASSVRSARSVRSGSVVSLPESVSESQQGGGSARPSSQMLDGVQYSENAFSKLTDVSLKGMVKAAHNVAVEAGKEGMRTVIHGKQGTWALTEAVYSLVKLPESGFVSGEPLQTPPPDLRVTVLDEDGNIVESEDGLEQCTFDVKQNFVFTSEKDPLTGLVEHHLDFRGRVSMDNHVQLMRKQHDEQTVHLTNQLDGLNKQVEALNAKSDKIKGEGEAAVRGIQEKSEKELREAQQAYDSRLDIFKREKEDELQQLHLKSSSTIEQQKQDLQKLGEEYGRLQRQHQEDAKKHAETSKTLDDVNLQLSEVRSQYNRTNLESEARASEVSRLESIVSKHAETIAGLQRQAQGLQNGHEKEKQDLERQLLDLNDRYRQAAYQLEQAMERCGDLQGKLEQLKRDYQILRQVKSRLEKEVEETAHQEDGALQRLQELTRLSDSVNKALEEANLRAQKVKAISTMDLTPAASFNVKIKGIVKPVKLEHGIFNFKASVSEVLADGQMRLLWEQDYDDQDLADAGVETELERYKAEARVEYDRKRKEEGLRPSPSPSPVSFGGGPSLFSRSLSQGHVGGSGLFSQPLYKGHGSAADLTASQPQHQENEELSAPAYAPPPPPALPQPHQLRGSWSGLGSSDPSTASQTVEVVSSSTMESSQGESRVKSGGTEEEVS